MKDSEQNIAQTYDDVPYESFPFKQSHPTHLFTIATLFGLEPTPVEESRILELGCAAGGNIIPIATHYPKAKIVGIDFSSAEIEMGKNKIQALGLENIELRHQSILDFEKNEDLFDYIICHDVYSLVPDEVRESILTICNQNLSKNGITYISYNTLPGWNMVNNIRELMLWHTDRIENPSEKVKHARGILKFIADGLAEDQSPYANFLKQEINSIQNQSDYYIRHEHLSIHNKSFYFNEFITQATKHNLSFLGDAALSSMYTENLPEKFSKELHKNNNIVVSNQYMDFIRNKRFSCTILCHDNIKIERKLKTEEISRFYLRINAKPTTKITENMIFDNSNITFQVLNIKMSSDKTFVKAVLYILWQNRFKLISYNTLFQELKTMLNKSNKETHQALQVEANLFRMALAGLVELSCYPSQHTIHLSEKPMVCPLARHQAKTQNSITNRNHQNIKLENIEAHVLQLLDGRHQISDIQEEILSKIDSGELNILDAQKHPIMNHEQKHKIVEAFVHKALERFCQIAVLIK